MKIRINDKAYNPDREVDDRQITTSSTALGILRHQLAQNIGVERIKGFLIRFGWEMGVTDAKQALKTDISLETLIEQGPIVHMNRGHIRGFSHECTVEFDDDHNIVSLLGKGTWIDSFEAIEHVKRLGISDTQVCHTLVGYSNGFMSTICGHTVLTKEITCVGKGDAECSWITRTQKEWQSDMNEELYYYEEIPIMKELEYTYEQLLEQQQFVTKLSNFQKRLTEEISNGSNLQTIANLVYTLVQIPILIEDTDFRTITYAGLSEESYLALKADMDQYIQAERKDKQLLPLGKRTIRTNLQERLITPIFVQKRVLGYCSFIYGDLKNNQPEEDYLLLDRFANAASLILLNEKTRFESFERMKGIFLEQILQAQLPTNEIIKRGKYANLDLEKSYYIVVMQYQKTERSRLSIEEEFYLQEQFLESIFQFFNKKKYQVLTGQREGKLIFLVMKNDQIVSIEAVTLNLNEYLTETFPRGAFKFGISNEGDDIQQASSHYEEAMIALRLAIKKQIVPFHSLGIVGVLINSHNINGIKMMAQKELGSLYDTEDPKVVELLKTIYIYLSNGGKLEQTMNELALSMSGLRHRIKKIESLLEKDLRNPDDMHELLMIIKALIALGELEME